MTTLRFRTALVVCAVVTGVISIALASTAAAVEARLPRHPAPSPDGSTIAVSWQGDLWLVPTSGGDARRITAHPATDRHPVWSRDGSMIAFASDRYGNWDVFVLRLGNDTPPRRLTAASLGDTPVDFTPDGSTVLFVSERDESLRFYSGLYEVPVAGGTPRLAQSALGEWGAYSADGSALAFVRGGTKWTRRGYRGAANRDIWLRTADDEYVQLTDFDGDDDVPSWIDGHTLAILSAREGRKNVFLLDLITERTVQLTHHTGSDVRFPRASVDGSIIAYEHEDAIYTVRPHGGEPQKLSFEVPVDQIRNPIERHTARADAADLAIDAEGTLAAFTVHGDIFVTGIVDKEELEIAEPPTVQVTATPAEEDDLQLAPDGDAVVYSAERDGQRDLYLLQPAGADDDEPGWLESFEFTETQLTSSPDDEHSPRFSPDGSKVAYLKGRGDLHVLTIDSGEDAVLFEHWAPSSFHWSPDGQWIAFSRVDTAYNADVWVVPAAGGEAYNVSRHPDDDHNPHWSPDGKRLVWTSKRHADTDDVWGVWLTRADDERTPAQWLAYWKAQEAARKQQKNNEAKESGDDSDASDDEDAVKPAPEVAIDFDQLWRRAEPITALLGDEASPFITEDGRRVLFTAEIDGERDLYSVRFDGEDRQRLTTGDRAPRQLQLRDDTVFFLDSKGTVGRVSVDGKAGDPVPFAATYEIDRNAEREVVFEQAWRALDQIFYDPDFHGVDWQQQRATYRPWALAASSEADFADVMNLMLGELNASHMGYYPPGTRGNREGSGERTGWIGAVLDPALGPPGIAIAEVLPDTPAARTDVNLKPGERILAVGGAPVTETTNIYLLLADTVGKRVPLTVRGIDGAERSVVVIPESFRRQYQARYEQWVRQRRTIVDELSEGRLGYLHIQGMNTPSFEDFERDLYAAAHGKEGLIIDVRSNGGGWTTDYLMTVLSVERHAYTIPRGAPATTRDYPQSRLPLAAWTRPALTLCNSDSYSNAEIFSWAFSTLDRGLLVGTPTFGAVISTGGTRLINGALVRLPMRGWYVAEDGTNMELNGAQPDIVVEQPPSEDLVADRDTQLARAVEAFLDTIEDDPRHGAW
jgi:tricorn protease